MEEYTVTVEGKIALTSEDVRLLREASPRAALETLLAFGMDVSMTVKQARRRASKEQD